MNQTPPPESTNALPPKWVLPVAIAAMAIQLGLMWTPVAVWGHWVAMGGLVLAGLPLVVGLVRGAMRGEWGADLLAGVSIATSLALGEALAGLLVVTMLAGGMWLEARAVGRASSALRALADRLPRVAHRWVEGQAPVDVAVEEVKAGDALLVLPHEVVPVDGEVVRGHTRMNEAYLTGEPWEIEKAPGATVISGAVNGDAQIVMRASRVAAESRYARILEVMKESEENRPRLRRLGDQLGAWYTPLALTIAGVAWAVSGEAVRFLSVLVVATPCPLLIAIPVALVGTVSQAARRGIVIRNPVLLERIDSCRTLVLDKTGTLTAGRPVLVEQNAAAGFAATDVLTWVGSLEQYSRHPLATAIVQRARDEGVGLQVVDHLTEPPGKGLVGEVQGRTVELTSRKRLLERLPDAAAQLPPTAAGLECVVLVDGAYAATYRFEDAPRPEGRSFIDHLLPRHRLDRVMIVSGDREAEVQSVGAQLGITLLFGGQSPADKVRIVTEETARAPTLFVGDGINDAPALAVATVGVAFGTSNDVSAGAAHAVILEPTLLKLDELMHLATRFRHIALQSAIGGMALSVLGMAFAAAGLLGPVAAALLQEGIDLASILNALRTTLPPRHRTDVGEG
jgi:heavy metal translocating P-type ATPase